MLIDGRKVLYSVKAKKLVYPEIPTEGLVCYLDARGKTNNDKHKGTLIDLSGNGNHVTLQNFNFTEESGYENGGLKFDGVDDKLKITLDTLQNFTIIAKIKDYITPNRESRYVNADQFLCFYSGVSKRFEVRISQSDGTISYLGPVRNPGNLIYTQSERVARLKWGDFTVNREGVKEGLSFIEIGHSNSLAYANLFFKKLYIYNRALADTEITQILTA